MQMQAIQPVPLRDELRAVPRPVLEEYVSARVKQFSRLLVGVLLPGVTDQTYEHAYLRTQQLLGTTAQEMRVTDSYVLRFTHRCRFLGCLRKECALCKNNPNKKCREEDNFDECYADGQVLKSKCEADVYLELINLRTNQPEALPSVEIAVSVVDGESYSESSPSTYAHVKELLKNDDESILLGAYQAGTKTEADGRLYLRMNEGQVKLPDVCVTDKNDTFHLNGETFSTFRLMARAVRRDGLGHLQPVDNVRPSVSGRFIVKTQRALNDYRKSDYPHYKDELTKLKHIGSITAQRLRDISTHLESPFTSVETVEQLKQLMQYADQNRQVENKMLELLNMKGKHKHKWDYLREVLAERVVYDDMLHRIWYADECMSQGVIFTCKQGQVNLDRPYGLVQRAPATGRLVVTSNPTGPEAEMLKHWRGLAEESWNLPGHRGWVMVQEQLEMATPGSGSASLLMGGGASISMAPSVSLPEGMDEQMLARRGSIGIAPPPMMVADSARSRRSSTVSYPGPGPSSPDMSAQGFFNMHQQQQVASAGYSDAALSQQAMAGHAGAQSQFQFAGNRGFAAPGTLFSNGLADDLSPDVYRVASAPNVAVGACLFPQQSMDSGGAANGMFGTVSSPVGAMATVSSPLGHLTGQVEGILGPPPVRSGRYRRLSADAGAMRQMAGAQTAALQQQQPNADLSVDLSGKRCRASHPGHQALEELQQLHQQSAPGGLDLQLGNRHALYHFESRGRHTPRGRVNAEVSETVAANALGSVLDASDLDTYLAQNFSFVPGTTDSSFSGSAVPDQRAFAAAGTGLGLGAPGSVLQSSMQQSDQLTGQMQHTLILNDPVAGRMGPAGATNGSGLLTLDSHHSYPAGSAPGAGNGVAGSSGVQLGRGLQHVDSGGLLLNQANRELRRCESDSFKRFLTMGLPFSPMEPTPEELLEGIGRETGFLGT
ncbi:hypothetical protein Agub_g4882 [Astrephomene gubernaculifera]|uniref:Uncharacterized protein n=1 Tax=Astrephomene gubernaculifera TaxID=47775 RepID=A0AAD3DLF1_9CHLO|nr:hypothetical protein Agub_g4882 [Astrephomene gubernaculifera]